MEIVALVRTYRDEACPHGKAVHVAGYITVHVGKFFVSKL